MCVCEHAYVHVSGVYVPEVDVECVPQLFSTPFLDRIPRTQSSQFLLDWLASGMPFSAHRNTNFSVCPPQHWGYKYTTLLQLLYVGSQSPSLGS